MELKIKAITSVELSSMSFNELPSLFFLYENLVNKRFESIHKNDRRKFEEFKKVHQYHAIKSSFYSLKLRDVIMIESFNAENLEILSKKVNWTEREITKYGFLGKEKQGTNYQLSIIKRKKEFIFYEPALADFFIAQYFYDNLVHPKDHPSDDEVELRIRFFLHIIVDKYDTKHLTNEFITGMIEDQNGEIFSDQVRMLMKYRFKYLLDRFLPDQLDFVEKVTKMFSKDEEILGNLWGINDNQPFFIRFFRFTSSGGFIHDLKAVAEKFFRIGADSQANTNLTSNATKLQAENIFRGKNQVLNVLYRIHAKKDENFTKDILDVTKYEVSDEVLTKLSQEKNFLDFVDTSSFTTAEKREFYLANSFDLISNNRNGTDLLKLWHRIEKYFSNDELKEIITQKETDYNRTQLFLLPSENDHSFVETFLNLTKIYLSKDEIKDFLNQRHPISQQSFINRYMIIIRKFEILEMNYNFAKEYLTHDELKKLLFDHNDTPYIHKMSANKITFKFFMKIVSELYTKDEIMDMLMETDEYNHNIIYQMVETGNKYNKRHDVADYLRQTFKDHQDKLEELFTARDESGQTVFGQFTSSWYKDGFEPFLELAKEIFTPEEIEELYKNKEIKNLN